MPRAGGPEGPQTYAERKRIYDDNYEAAYGCDTPYPAKVAEFVRRAGYRKYNLVDVRVTPFSYRPASGRLARPSAGPIG